MSIFQIIVIDYFLATGGGIKLRWRRRPDGSAPERRDRQVMSRCYASKVVFCHVILCKGLDEDGFIVDVILADLELLGHTRIIPKAENEVAIKVLARKAIELSKVEINDLEQVSMEVPATDDSMFNVGTKIWVRLLRGFFGKYTYVSSSASTRRSPWTIRSALG